MHKRIKQCVHEWQKGCNFQHTVLPEHLSETKQKRDREKKESLKEQEKKKETEKVKKKEN